MRNALKLVSIPNRVIAYLAVGSCLLLILAFVLDEQFLKLWDDHPLFSGVLAGVFTVPMSLILAAFLVEYGIASDRERRWKRVHSARRHVIHETSALVAMQLSAALLGGRSGLATDTNAGDVADAIMASLARADEAATGVALGGAPQDAKVAALLRAARYAGRVVRALEALQEISPDEGVAKGADDLRHAIDEIEMEFGAFGKPSRGAYLREVGIHHSARTLLQALDKASGGVASPDAYWAPRL